MAGRRSFLDADDDKVLSAPTMSRSRNQLASAYAPGSFFTFEGGLGASISLPDLSDRVDEAQLTDETKSQILLRLQEVWQSWFSRAYVLNQGARIIDPRLCIDDALLRGGAVAPLGADKLAFVSPLKMGYAPAPLTFVCNNCYNFKRFEKTSDLAAAASTFTHAKCSAHGGKRPCQWRQLDVIFVHWSGEWMPATPGRWEWSDRTQELRLAGEVCTVCHSKDFKLITASPRIGEWHFQCGNCGHKGSGEWRQNDKFTTGIFRTDASRRMGERRMEPISYRASSAYYAQSEQFVLFAKKDQNLLSLLEPGRHAELADFIGSKFRYGGSEPTPQEMKAMLLASGHGGEWEVYETQEKLRSMSEASGDKVGVAMLAELTRKLVQRWRTSEPPLVPVRADLPSEVLTQLAQRTEYTSRYDPFVLAVEHEALHRSKLSAAPQAGRSAFVRLRHLDNDLAPNSAAEKLKQEEETGRLTSKLGFTELGLIREFEICRFTHGYSRVSPVPTLEKHQTTVPVRLRLFDSLRSGKRPIYVVTQENEALYAQLDPTAVYAWLSQLGVTDLPEWEPKGPVLLGGRLLEVAQPFGRYFSKLSADQASTYRYAYTLLHSYSHLFMKTIAEYSGLDLGSMSEYVFPADLAFVVYRNGTTMDLGNLSSLWRNENNRFLARMLEPSSHRCNSGSLCDFNGGACPDCIMVPETSCVAQNRLLSRAVLRGGPAPREDATHKGKRIRGFLEVVNDAGTS